MKPDVNDWLILLGLLAAMGSAALVDPILLGVVGGLAVAAVGLIRAK